MAKASGENWTQRELRDLPHNDHREAIRNYLRGARHARDKQDFLLSWVSPGPSDLVLECGSSSGKTCIDLARRGGCRTLGVDFDPEAVAIATEARDVHFPELRQRCRFQVGDLAEMTFPPDVTKVLMPDFTEHVPDAILEQILDNIRRQLPRVSLYVYTPVRTHLFERMRQRGVLLEHYEQHINVKSEAEMGAFLAACGWRVVRQQWRPSHLPVVRHVERVLGWLPLVGTLCHRRTAVVATPAEGNAGP